MSNSAAATEQAASRADHGLRDVGDADAGAGFHHRQRRAALYAGQPVGELRPDHLGADLLRRRGGDHDRAGRLAVRAVRPQEPVHRLPDRLHRHLDAVRHRRLADARWCCSGCCRACSARRWCRCRKSTMLDIYPPEQRGSAMAIWGMGVMVGPILGPTLGGYLTEFYNWRYVFFVNLPFGIIAVLGLRVPAKADCRSRACASTGSASRLLAIGIAGAATDAGPRRGRRTGSARPRSSSRRSWPGSASTCSSCTC